MISLLVLVAAFAVALVQLISDDRTSRAPWRYSRVCGINA